MDCSENPLHNIDEIKKLPNLKCLYFGYGNNFTDKYYYDLEKYCYQHKIFF